MRRSTGTAHSIKMSRAFCRRIELDEKSELDQSDTFERSGALEKLF